MDIEKRIDDLINSKNWEDLTSEEKQFILSELGSEELFHAMKKMDSQLTPVTSKISPRPETLASLRQRLRQSKVKESSGFLAFLFLRTPAYATILIFLLAVSVGWFTGRSSSGAPVVMQTVYKTDTVRLTAPGDTVFITSVVYRDRPVLPNAIARQPDPQSSAETHSPMSVSMKEKEELVNLLVSGSE